MGPYIGVVVNNYDATRSGLLQVYIEQFGETTADGKPNLADTKLWRTVRYCPPFFGYTANQGPGAGIGTYPGPGANSNSYGMWFTAPDIGTQVICFFVGGDPLKGYYLGCVPGSQRNHMVPAIGSSTKYSIGNQAQKSLFANTPLLPVTEINTNDRAIAGNPRFFDQTKPVQSVVAGILVQQGLSRDPVRGPIRSSAQRESPSTVYGISTPGRPIYNGGLDPKTIKNQLEKGQIKPQDAVVISRKGGHTFVMDDGDLEGTDELIRIRTAKGHQITMSDNGDCFYIIHSNGQTWLEFGKQGTVDVFSTNSINLRTQGQLNMHADKGINMYSGTTIRMKSKSSMAFEATTTMSLIGMKSLTAYSKTALNLKSDGRLAMASQQGSWNAGKSLSLKAEVINLNGGSTIPVPTPVAQQGFKLSDTVFIANQGWVSKPRVLDTIVTRAPTHEPYQYHNQGVDLSQNLDSTTATAAPSPANSLLGRAESLFNRVESAAVTNGVSAADFLKTLPANGPIPPTAEVGGDGLSAALSAAEALARGTVTGTI
jgi:hypothetical protein